MKQGNMWILDTPFKLSQFAEHIRIMQSNGEKPIVKFVEDASTPKQNIMQFALYRDIAKYMEQPMEDIQAYCKLHFGIGILKASDPAFAEFYDSRVKGLSYEAKTELMKFFDVTSRPEFKKKEMSEYIDTILAHFGGQGVPLARKDYT